MVKCANCGTPIPENARFCSECGCKVDPQHTCPKCGNKVSTNDKFCMQCGTILTPVAPPYAPNTNNASNTHSPYSQEAKKEETIVMRCPKCGKIVKDDTEECPDCHYKFSHTYKGPSIGKTNCPSCGATISDMNRICPECGCRISEAISTPKKPFGTLSVTQEAASETVKKARHHNTTLAIVIIAILILSAVIFSFIRQNHVDTPYIQNEETPQTDDAVEDNDMVAPSFDQPETETIEESDEDENLNDEIDSQNSESEE